MVRREPKLISSEVSLVARKTAAELTLQELASEHERLLREIGKAQRRLSDARTLQAELHTRVALELEPIQRQLSRLVNESAVLFERLLSSDSPLSRRHKTTIRPIQAAFERDFGVEERQPHAATPDAYEPRANPGPLQPAHKPDTERAATLHATFRRLVNAVHPDKVQSLREKEERTELLKDVTRAYETADLARMVQLEDTLLAKAPVVRDTAFVERRVKELTVSNAELRRQLKFVTRELRAVRRSLPETPDGRDDAAGQWITSHASMGRRQVDRLTVTRDLLREVNAGKVSAIAFLDASWQLANEAPEPVEYTRAGASTRTTAVSEINQSNVEGVLDAFKQHLENTRKR